MYIRAGGMGRFRRQPAVTMPLVFVVMLAVIWAAPAPGWAGTYFDPQVSYSVSLPHNFFIKDMSPGDIDNDGLPDLILTGATYAYGSVILKMNEMNQPAGGFREVPVNYLNRPVNPAPVAATAINFTADDRVDIATVNANGYTNNRAMFYQNMREDVFNRLSMSYPVGRAGQVPLDIVAVDFDTDTDTDLVVASFLSGRGSGSLTFLMNNSMGSFSPQYVDLAHNPSSLVAADFDQDERVDLAYTSPDDASITVLINETATGSRASVSLQERYTGLVDVAPSRLIVGDFDGTNGPDLALIEENSNMIYVMFNDGAGFFLDPAPPAVSSGPVGALAAGDVDLDGKQDLIVATADTRQVELFFYNAGEDRFSHPVAGDTVGPDPVSLIATDLNGDEKVDLASANGGDNTVSVLINHYEPVVDVSELVAIGEVSTRKAYALTPLEQTRVYIDRPYSIVEMSAGLEGGMLLQTANNDKWVRTDRHLQLWVHGEALLLVCYDSRARRLPTWLREGGWTPTMEWIRSTDHRAGNMQVFMKEVTGTMDAPAEIWLGGNHEGGDTRARSNYYLVVQPKGAPIATPPVEIVGVSTRKPYRVTRLQEGGRIYIDRNYRLLDYSEAFDGAVLVQTANNDKWVRNSSHLKLKMNSDATVFACYDRRARRLPAWLDDGSWEPTHLRFYSTDRRAGPMTVWMRRVSSGELLCLGGNHEGGYTRARSNYLVIVQTAAVDITAPEAPLVQAGGRRNFQLTTAEPGSRVYMDRSYRIQKISDRLRDGILVMTANNDKWYRGGSYMQLQVREQAYVYVCFDKRKAFLPQWLADGDWHPTGESILTRDRRAGPMPVYMRSLAAGETLTLGGNHQGGDNRARSNYFVVVQPSH